MSKLIEAQDKSPSQSSCFLQVSSNQIRNTSPRTPDYDRFIPNRCLANHEASYHLLTNKSVEINKTEPQNPGKVLHLSHKKEQNEDNDDELKMNYLSVPKSKVCRRIINSKCQLVLDAPDVIDDFYLNLIDWSCTDKLAVGLGDEVFLWNHRKRSVCKLVKMSNENQQDLYITSLKWTSDGQKLAIGISNKTIEIWDVNKLKCISQTSDHFTRVSSMDFNDLILSSGAQDGRILNHDLRIMKKINEIFFHNKVVCGLKWNNNGRFLASGGDDKIVSVWDIQNMSSETPYKLLDEHNSAIKALSWCPWQNNLLASGGGTSDGCIKFWNIYSGARINNVETHSQITGLVWSSKTKELMSSHHNPDKSLVIWKYPNMETIGELCGHTKRVLSISLSHSQETVASLSADQTIRFWDCFKEDKKPSILTSPISINNLSQIQNIR